MYEIYMYCELTLYRQSQIQRLIETASATECQKDVNRSQKAFQCTLCGNTFSFLFKAMYFCGFLKNNNLVMPLSRKMERALSTNTVKASKLKFWSYYCENWYVIWDCHNILFGSIFIKYCESCLFQNGTGFAISNGFAR